MVRNRRRFVKRFFVLLMCTVVLACPIKAQAHLEKDPAHEGGTTCNGVPIDSYWWGGDDADGWAEYLIKHYIETIQAGYKPNGYTTLDAYMKDLGYSYTDEHINYVLSMIGMSRAEFDALCANFEATHGKGTGTGSTGTAAKADNACTHEYKEEVTTEPTCKDEGVKTFTCSKCGKSYTEKIEKTADHDYKEEVTTQATCTQSGLMTCTCSVCGDTYTKDIPKKDHSYAEVVVEATCTADGNRSFTCSVCGDAYSEIIPAKGHVSDEGVITKKANFFVSGVKTYTCKTCGEVLKTEKIPSGLQSLFK